jgi:hypothetical protein
MKSYETIKEKEARLASGYLPARCLLCDSESFVIEEFLDGEEECYLFKCANKKCKKQFVLDYNAYIRRIQSTAKD